MKTFETISVKDAWKALCFLLLMLAMISGGLAQETDYREETGLLRTEPMKNDLPSPDKSSGFRLNVVGSDALIHGLSVGRGGNSIPTNTALGSGALFSNTSGYNNTASGYQVLYSNTWGEFNTASGYRALYSNTWGYANTASGTWALYSNTLGEKNIASGALALYKNTTGYYNTASGYGALYSNITGIANTASGTWALASNTTGYSNVAIGMSALNENTDRSNLVAVGDSALYHNGHNVSLWYHATGNTALGSKALYFNTIGYGNTASGGNALYSNNLGHSNTASGHNALYSNTSGFSNTASGHSALFYNTTGIDNTACGRQALYRNADGNRNTAIGIFALRSLSYGSDNTAIGFEAGSGRQNISQGTFVGSGAYPVYTGLSNVTGIGYNSRPNVSNLVRIGNSAVTKIEGFAGWTVISDGHYKNNVAEEVAGLEFILRLRPVSYNLDVHKLAADLEEDITIDEDGNKSISAPDEITLKSRNDKASIRYTGFIAQEVEATVNELGVAFSGVDAPTNKESHYGLRYADFVVPLVKAVQEQQVQIELLEPAAVEALQQELHELNRLNTEIQNQLENVKAENEIMKDQLSQILSLLKEQGVDLGGITTGDPSRPGAGRSGRNAGTLGATLEQNTPNPFHENTVVRYYVPENAGKAQIMITDLQGNRIQTIDVNSSGHGEVTIQGGTLPTGTYVYSLLVGGQVADSKRMVLVM